MPWVKAKDRLPPAGSEIMCRLQHWFTGGIRDNRLRKVDEDDCSWRVAPGGDEVNHDWNVIEWEDDLSHARG